MLVECAAGHTVSHEMALQDQIVRFAATTLALLLLAGCDTLLTGETPPPPPSSKPVVTLISPPNGTSVPLDDAVRIDAIATDGSGILRVDLTVNGGLIDSQPLFVATRRFEYQSVWRPAAVGQNTLTIVAYNVNNVASDPVNFTVKVTSAVRTSTAAPIMPTPTPFVMFVTATPHTPTRAAITPIVTVVTATPSSTSTHTPANTLTAEPTVTGTVSPAVTDTLTAAQTSR
jgi:Bacterial Ig domain